MNSTILLSEIRISTEDILSDGLTIGKVIFIFLPSLLGGLEDIDCPLASLLTLGIFVEVNVIGDIVLLITPSVGGLHITVGHSARGAGHIRSAIHGSLVRHFGSLSTRDNYANQHSNRHEE